MKIIQNKSIMTSYISSPYFRHIPISVTLDLSIDHLKDVVKYFINAFSSVNDDASLDKVLHWYIV